MPSLVRSRHWFTQVDGPMEFCKQKLLMLGVELETALAVHHVGKKGDNPHFHMISTHTKEIQKQSWDLKLKKLFGVSGAQYSSKVWDANLATEGAGTYLFHEDPENAPILLCKNVSAEQIGELKRVATIINKVVEVNRDKAETKIPAKVLAKWNDDGKPQWGNREIVDYIIRMASQGECYLPKSDFMWKAYIEEIKMKMCDTPDKLNTFIYCTLDRLFPLHRL